MGTLSQLVFKNRWSGFIAFLKLKLGLTQSIKIDSLLYPVWLRPNTSDVTTFKHIFAHGDYDIDLNFEPTVIVDAGSNVGLASIYFTNKYPAANIIAIELAPSNFSVLLKNTSYYSNIKVINAGIWHKSEMLTFREKGVSHWGYKVESNIEGESISVPSTTMDGLMEENDLTSIDVLKVDIEGAEVELFSQNFENWLPKVKCLIIETHDRSRSDSTKTVKEALSNYNFSSAGEVGENLVFMNKSLI